MKLAPIGNGHQLEENAARYFLAMRASAKVSGHALDVSESFRTEAQQQALYDAWIARGKKPQPIVVDPKARKSAHQLGLSLDIRVGGKPLVLAWLRDHAGRYGFFETTKGEPWHWTFNASRATVKP